MFTVVLDACVLVPQTLADTVLRIAERGAFGVRWSATILDEVARTMRRLGATEAQVEHRISAMRLAFPFADVSNYCDLEPGLSNDPKDRHVLAAAIRSECHTVVTFNLKDFPDDSLEPWGVEVLHPDQFLLNQLDLAPGLVVTALQQQSAAYTDPPRTVDDILARLVRSDVPDFADECRRHLPRRPQGTDLDD
ncbi:PIN domain-containing protein [Luteipulveratus sp. YIM 133132]|uniref:PIN domain-containing protein n=1 Tax=Luteipulveratus flavus TaxID=3031728 RepID=UPI0023AF25EC|nr:PIN domain-containing protein [Luteipulveratus sp. YIM 133132]MDE9365682.1 PIN domain-containing protein [Luteipulveratus sp. YIM 133132]